MQLSSIITPLFIMVTNGSWPLQTSIVLLEPVHAPKIRDVSDDEADINSKQTSMMNTG